MRATTWGPRRSERGGVAVIVALSLTTLCAAAGISVDVGRMYVMKAELSRAADSAALSGVLEFDGTPAGLTKAENKAEAYFDANEPGATRNATAEAATNSLKMTASRTMATSFMKLVGINSVTVDASARAGFDAQQLDAALIIDSTGSMAGTPINEAKKAAKAFKDVLLGGSPAGTVSVGMAPFRGCFRANTPSAHAPKPLSSDRCVRDEGTNSSSEVIYLSTDKASLGAKLDNSNANGGSGTNVCGGLAKGWEVLEGPNNHTAAAGSRRFAVLLSDGDNNYNGGYSYQASLASPHSYQTKPCMPTPADCSNVPSGSGGCTGLGSPGDGGECQSSYKRERQLDKQTWEMAKAMEADGIEIYVVAFGICSSNATTYTQAQCDSQIGNTDPDVTADQRLMKCIASSATGTNNRYYYAATATELGPIFTSIAGSIGHRLID